IHWLLGGSGMNASEAAQRLGKVTVGARIVLCPTRVAFPPIENAAIAAGVAAEAGFGMLRIHEPPEGPLGFFVKIGRKRNRVVGFHAGVNAERPLPGVER